MSVGVGTHANLVTEEIYAVMYEYGEYYLKAPKYRNKNNVYYGAVTIQKGYFAEQIICE